MSKKWIIILIISGLIFIGVIGYLLGKYITERNYINSSNVSYISLPEIKGYVTDLTPTKVDIPNVIILDGSSDTIRFDSIHYEVIYKDTTSVITDYFSKRDYNKTLFDIDTVGSCDVNMTVQYNRLTSLSYNFNPIQKVTTNNIDKKENLSIFFGGGVGTNNQYNIQVGGFINHWGLSYQINNDFNGNKVGHNLNVFYKLNIK